MGTRQQGGTTESQLGVSGEWAEDVGLVCKVNVSDCNHRRGCTKYSGQNVRDDTSGGQFWMVGSSPSES